MGVMLYLENGDRYLGDKLTEKEALAVLRENGYKEYYRGIHYLDDKVCLVGINAKNKVGLQKRRANGLFGATAHRIEEKKTK